MDNERGPGIRDRPWVPRRRLAHRAPPVAHRPLAAAANPAPTERTHPIPTHGAPLRCARQAARRQQRNRRMSLNAETVSPCGPRQSKIHRGRL